MQNSLSNLAVNLTSFSNIDEFMGPFPSWANVKTLYGAKGDGINDDTPGDPKCAQ